MGYYDAACKAGDAYACKAGDIAGQRNFAGKFTTARFLALAFDAGVTLSYDDYNKIRLSLANRYASYLGTNEATAALPSRSAITQIHREVFAQWNIPPEAFGGSPAGGGFHPLIPPDELIHAFVPWCPNCRP